MLKIFKIEVNELDETGVDFLGLVDMPAHSKNFISFNKQSKNAPLYFANEEERIVTGVMISEGTPIFRSDEELGEHYVVFDKSTIKTIVNKFFKNGFITNVNEMHNKDLSIEGVHIRESYIANKANGLSPNNLGEDVRDGSWVASYKIDNDDIWNKVKSGEFKGFSVEGMFGRKQVEIKTNNKNKMSKTFKEILFGKMEDAKSVKFEEASTVDGVVLNYEGNLEIGTALTIEADGEQIPAPEGAHALGGELEGITVVLDASGVVIEIEEATAEEEVSEEVVDEEMKSDIASAIAEMAGKISEMASSFSEFKTEMEKSNEELVAKNLELTEKVEAFGKTSDSKPAKKKFRTEKKENIFINNKNK